MNTWIENNLMPGRDGNVLLTPMYQLTLQALMDQVVPENKVAQEETWLLMDHFNFMMMSNMDTTPGVRISPQDLEGLHQKNGKVCFLITLPRKRLIKVWVL